MADRTPCQHFMALPPEVRNRIYTFATYPTAGERCCVVPSLAFAQTCRQIRYEYRSMCLRADVTVDWRDVPSYIETFFPTREGKIENIDLAPERMTIFTNTYVKRDPSKTPVEIDLLPILKFGLANKTFTCQFVKCEVEDSPWVLEEEVMSAEMQTLLAADVKTIQKLLAHHCQDWMQDVTEGKVHRLIVSHIGTEDYPRARFCFGPGEYNTVQSKRNQMKSEEQSDAFHSHEADSSYRSVRASHTFDAYVRSVGLEDIFMENPYVFFWIVEWEQTERESGLSFFLD